jgi:two-component system, autoinducer 2 sensor kinase/phosphatase LuxQ
MTTKGTGMDHAALQQLMRHWPEPVLLLDAPGHIAGLSDVAVAVTGWHPDMMLGLPAHEVLCAKTYDHRHAESECPLLANTAGTLSSVYWVDGQENHISIDMRVLTAPIPDHRLIAFDVLKTTDYSHAELLKLARLCEVTPTPLLEVGSDGSIYFANPAMIQLMVDHGFDVSGAAELLPDNFPGLVHECVRKRKPLLNVEKNLRYLSFLWQMFPYDNGTETTVLVTGNDLTELNRATQRAKLSERQLLIERERMRREYVAKMVHDLRSPLNAIVGFASMLRHTTSDRLDQEELEMLDHIIGGGRDLANQINESLTQARVEAAQMQVTLQPGQLLPIIEQVAQTLAPLAADKNLRLAHSCEPLEVTADARLLGQALTNLVANAIKFTAYGSVTIEAHLVDAKNYRITVSDTGCGIPEDEIRSIFSPYVRQQKHDQATIEGQGLGLAIVSDIVSLHGGSVSVDSHVGKGTRFTLSLPLSP